MPTSSQVASGARFLQPEDLYRLRVPTQPRLTPDGRLVLFVVQSVAPDRRGYRHAIWAASTDGSGPATQLTIGAGHDTQPRVSPDGRQLGFLSDRRPLVEPGEEDDDLRPGRRHPDERPEENQAQVYVLPLDGPGEARRVTDLPRGVVAFEWAPDGRRLAVLSSSVGPTRDADRRRRGLDVPRPPAAGPVPPLSDYRYVDRLSYLANGEGFVYDRRAQLWLVELDTGAARRLTAGAGAVEAIAWSPDGTRIAYATNANPDYDIEYRCGVWVVDVASGRRTRLTGPARSYFHAPAWLGRGDLVAALGHRFEAHIDSRQDVWLFAADGSDAGAGGGRNLSARHDLMPGTSMNSDLTVGEPARLVAAADGASLTFLAPIDGSYEAWRIRVADGELERLTTGRQYVSSFDQVGGSGSGTRAGDAATAGALAFVRSTPVEMPDVFALGPDGTAEPRRLTDLNADALSGVRLVAPVERRDVVDGRPIQGWLIEAPQEAGFRRAGPLVVEIHGGPATQYGWSPFLEFQVLAGRGVSVYYCNPRGSTGYGQEFVHANWRDWGDGPTRDVLAGVDAIVAEGVADRARLGVTGGSYGGYLTNWIVGHDDRFRAALTCRSVSDMVSQMLTGDIAGIDVLEQFGSTPWDDPAFYQAMSPLTYIARCRTPLLIQHAENDLRCPIGQAEELFAVLRANHRPVRLMRVPGESHELTRSGSPFRRVENLVQVRDWFVHYLVRMGTRLPPLPQERAGK